MCEGALTGGDGAAQSDLGRDFHDAGRGVAAGRRPVRPVLVPQAATQEGGRHGQRGRRHAGHRAQSEQNQERLSELQDSSHLHQDAGVSACTKPGPVCCRKINQTRFVLLRSGSNNELFELYWICFYYTRFTTNKQQYAVTAPTYE